MTESLDLRLDTPKAIHRPGEEVTGVAAWELEKPPGLVELRAVWVLESRGGEDVGVAETVSFPAPAAADRRAFRLRLPDGPPSFQGRLMRLTWTLELVAEPAGASRRLGLHLSPTGSAIHLPALADEPPEGPAKG